MLSLQTNEPKFSNETLYETQIFIKISFRQNRKNIFFVSIINLIKTRMQGITILISTVSKSNLKWFQIAKHQIQPKFICEDNACFVWHSTGFWKPKLREQRNHPSNYLIQLSKALRKRTNIDCANRIDTAYQLQISLANVYCWRTMDWNVI